MKAEIAGTLFELGINPKHKAFAYFHELFVYAEAHDIMPLKYSGYVHVARKFSTSVACVDKAVQNAVSSAWNRKNCERLYAEFGETIEPDRGKPTAKQLIVHALTKIYGRYPVCAGSCAEDRAAENEATYCLATRRNDIISL